MFARLLYGARTSRQCIFTQIIVIVIKLPGGFLGFSRGRLDNLMMRFVDHVRLPDILLTSAGCFRRQHFIFLAIHWWRG